MLPKMMVLARLSSELHPLNTGEAQEKEQISRNTKLSELSFHEASGKAYVTLYG